MKTKLITLVIVIFAFLLASCASTPELTEPEVSYWEYYEACADSDTLNAQLHLSDQALATTQSVGVCGFTHDAITSLAPSLGGVEVDFSDQPEVNVNDSFATLTWFDAENGYLAIVSMVKVGQEWKVANTRWST